MSIEREFLAHGRGAMAERTAEEGDLPPTVLAWIDGACDRFEADWRAGRRPRAEDFLNDASESARPALLRELLRLELAYRLRDAEVPAPGEYRARFPQHSRLIDSLFQGAVTTAGEDTSRAPISLPDSPAVDPPTLTGYEILGELGRGGMGVVYRAHDRGRDQLVALKTMRVADPLGLDLFKREFRQLQGVSHPNLVQLYDLESDGRHWLLTMELVEGVDFLTYVRPHADQGDVQPTALPGEPNGGMITPEGEVPPLDEGRLRGALGQLAEGIASLHGHRRVHRDLKPSNVRVTPAGRVVVLDFGLAAILGSSCEHRQAASRLAGTPSYMAPEQLALPPSWSPASDWYSLGLMLYQALTGRLPHSGGLTRLARVKQVVDPPSPRELCPAAPPDLDELCVALLRRRPEDRPGGSEILARLGRGPVEIPTAVAAGDVAPLMGRERHLQFLEQAYRDSREAGAVLVAVHGPSGMGKSALVGRFLDEVRGRGAIVLAGRCYEHESVPYKALDPVVDELARHLRRRPAAEIRECLPGDVGPLTQVFPVLLSVEVMAEAAAGYQAPRDLHEVRRRAFAGLRELLGRMAEMHPLVVHIDDLQWGDVDSAPLLADLVRPPSPPPLLLVASYRSEDIGCPCLKSLAESLTQGEVVDRRELAVSPLAEDEARALVVRLLGDGAAGRAGTIARESGGNPYFVMELVQEARTGADRVRDPEMGGAVTIDGLIRTRVGRLPDGARRLLEVVALSSRPLNVSDALQAADAGADGRTWMTRLEAGRFLRGTGSAERPDLETYHDRIREAVAAGLAPEERRGYHERLARILETSGRGEAEQLAVHFEGAGEAAKAGHYFRRAADHAAETLAFDHAANLYRKALELHPIEGAEGRELRTKLGDALANAGRGVEAGPAYLAAAEGADATTALELRRRAADQFLLSGCTQDGLNVLIDLLKSVGMRLPGGPLRTILALIWERARLGLRGLSYRERAADRIPPEELLAIDVCDTAARRLSFMKVGESFVFRTRQVRLALDAGEPSRVASALSLTAAGRGAEGGKHYRAAQRLSLRAMSLAHRLDDPFLLAKGTLADGIARWGSGHWEEALALFDRSQQIASERNAPFASVEFFVHEFSFGCLAQMGEWLERDRRLPPLLADARRRGDRLMTSLALVHSIGSHLAAGRPGEVERVAREAVEVWPQSGVFPTGCWALIGRVDALLYRGEAREAYQLFHREWPAVGRSTFISYIEFVIVVMTHLRAKVALSLADADDAGRGLFDRRARLLHSASREARRIERRRRPWSDPLAKLVRAGIASLRGRGDEAPRLLAAAEEQFTAARMRMYAAAARRHRGRLLGGEEGRMLIEAADEVMTEQGVREPDRIAAMLAPGFGLQAKDDRPT